MTKSYCVSLGPVGHQAALAWPLDAHAQNPDKLILSLRAGSVSVLPWLVLLGTAGYKVLPCKAVSPAGSFLRSGRRLGHHVGVVFSQTGAGQTLLENAAHQGFWQWGKQQLETLATELGLLHVQPWDLLVALLQLIDHISGPVPPAKRAAAETPAEPEDLPHEEVEGMVDPKDQREVQDSCPASAFLLSGVCEC